MEKFCHLPTQATLGKPTFQFDAFLTILDKLFTQETKLSFISHGRITILELGQIFSI